MDLTLVTARSDRSATADFTLLDGWELQCAVAELIEEEANEVPDGVIVPADCYWDAPSVPAEVREAINGVGGVAGEVLTLVDIEGATIEEVAEDLGRDVTDCALLLDRGRAMVADRLSGVLRSA
jgi:DNA-directed RNA polymerase specialized sigma24 family protein